MTLWFDTVTRPDGYSWQHSSYFVEYLLIISMIFCFSASPKITLVYQGEAEKQKIIDMINKYSTKYELCCHEYPSGLVTVSNQSVIRLIPMEVV